MEKNGKKEKKEGGDLGVSEIRAGAGADTGGTSIVGSTEGKGNGMMCLGRDGMELSNGGRLPLGNDGITSKSGKDAGMVGCGSAVV